MYVCYMQIKFSSVQSSSLLCNLSVFHSHHRYSWKNLCGLVEPDFTGQTNSVNVFGSEVATCRRSVPQRRMNQKLITFLANLYVELCLDTGE